MSSRLYVPNVLETTRQHLEQLLLLSYSQKALVLTSPQRVVKYPAARSADSRRISPIPSSCGAFGSRGRSPFQ